MANHRDQLNEWVFRTMRVIILLAFILFSSMALTESNPAPSWKLELVASDFSIPWAMAFVSSNQLLITERSGSLKLLDVPSGQVQQVKGVPKVFANGQGGLLDVAVPSNYKSQGWIYMTYSKPIGAKEDIAVTTLARAKLKGNRLVEFKDLLVTQSVSDTSRHFGSRIAFNIDKENPEKSTLFFTVGDRGVRPNGQDLSNHAGTVIRLYLDGTVPEDNPLVGRKGALPEIWSYGHRNPQGIVFDGKTNRLWLIEHGPRGGDEINLIKRGANYGWPIVSHGKEYWGPFAVGEGTEKPGMESPKKVYIPSIAPGSLLLYSGNVFPQWQGDLFSGALKLTHLNRIFLNKQGSVVGEERLLEEKAERIRALQQSTEGWIYLSTDSGNIYRLVNN